MTRKVAPPPAVSEIPIVPLVRRDDRGDDREAEPAAAGVARAREVSARQKRWKILSRICGGMPSPWSMTSMHGERRAAWSTVRRDLDGGAVGREADGVADEVGEHLAQLVLLRQHDGAGRAGTGSATARSSPSRGTAPARGCRRAAARRREPVTLAASALTPRRNSRLDVVVAGPASGSSSADRPQDLDGAGRLLRVVADHADRRGSGRAARASMRGVVGERQQLDGGALQLAGLVEPGELEQVVDERADPDRLPLDAVHRLGDVLAGLQRAHPVQLGVAAHRDQRGAQLVAGVADEPPHLVDGAGAVGEARGRCGSACVFRERLSRPTSVFGVAPPSRWLKSPSAIAAAVRSTSRSGANVEPTSTRVSTAPTITTTMPKPKNSVEAARSAVLMLSSGDAEHRDRSRRSSVLRTRHPEGARRRCRSSP